jgi:ubiquinone biosynthesis protein
MNEVDSSAGQDIPSRRRAPQDSSHVWLADRLRELGPCFLAAGRYLALRPDALPSVEYHRLLDLEDRVNPEPWAVIRRLLIQEQGRDLSEELTSIDRTATRSGPLMQVHRGEHRDGTPVTVKVVRPGAPQVAAALKRSRRLERILMDAGVPANDVPALADEMWRWLDQELDLTKELANMVRLQGAGGRSAWERVPRPFPALSSSRVLVAEDLEAVAVKELLDETRQGGEAADDRLRELGIDRHRLARRIALTNLRQIGRYRFFQVDMHPRNVVALPGDVVTFADFGHYAELSPSDVEDQVTYLSAVYDEDIDRMLDPPLDPAPPGEEGELPAFRRDLLKRARARLVAVSRPSNDDDAMDSRERSSPTEFLLDVLRTGRAHDVRLAEHAGELYRSLAMAQATALRLDQQAGVVPLTQDFLRMSQLDLAIRKIEPEGLEQQKLTVMSLLHDSPGQLQKLLSDLADGSFSLNVYVVEAPQVVRHRNRRTRLVVGAIASVSVALLITVPDLPRPFGVPLAWPLGVILAALYGWLALGWWRLR